MKKLITFISLCLVGSSAVFAQTEPTRNCGTYEALQEALEMYPELEEGYEAHKLLMNSYQGNSAGNNPIGVFNGVTDILSVISSLNSLTKI